VRRWRVPVAGVLAGLLLVGVYMIGFHGPRSDEIAALVADIDLLRGQQEPLRREIEGLEDVAAREPRFTTALQVLEGLIPAGLAQPTLLRQLQSVADGAGVKLLSVTFGDPEVSKGAPTSPVAGTVLVALPLTVVVEGTFVRITDLLHRVEVELDRAVLVGALALTEGSPRFPQLTGTWSGQAYALLPADDPLIAAQAPQGVPEPTTPEAKP
jgi:hypothetical protein